MASEIRVDTSKNTSGLCTVAYTNTGAVVSGIVTANSFSGDITGNITGGATGDFSIVDKIIHTGDTNTALRFPTTDVIAFETAGNERARFDSDGRFLVNTDSNSISSSEIFEVKSTGNGFSHFRNNSSSYATIYIDNEYSDTGFAPFFTFTDGGGNRGGIGQDQNDLLRITGQGGVSLYSGGTHGGGTGRLHVTSDGKVGIGTDSPQEALEIGNQHTNPVIRLNDSAGRRMSIRGPSTSNNASVGTESSHDMMFFTNGYSNERFRITSGGDILIGTTSLAASNLIDGSTAITPNLQLDGTGSSANTSGVINLSRKTGSGGSIIYSSGDDGGLCLRNTDGNGITLINTTTKAVRITPTGDVGIANNSPNCRLAITDVAEHTAYASVTPSVGDCMVQLYNNPPNETANDHATIQFGVNGGSHNRVNTISAVAESAGNRKLAFTFCTDEAGSRTEKLRISGDGNLEKRAGGSYFAYDSQGHLAKQDNYDTNGGKSYWYDASAANGGTNQAYIDGQSGDIMAKGNFVVGTTGKGINFSVTSDASGMTNELLDDYEEGTWTPGFEYLTVDSGVSSGKYLKIGNLCWITCFVKADGAGSTSSAVRITGLPYNRLSGADIYFSPFFTKVDTDEGGFGPVVHGYSYGSDKIIFERQNPAEGGSNAYLTANHCGDDAGFHCTFTYRTT